MRSTIINIEKYIGKKPQFGPMNDVIFKCIFGNTGNEEITKSFLESVIGNKILSISTDCKVNLQRENIKDKEMEADVIAKDNELKKYIMEMQRKSHNYLPDRFVGYLARTYVADIQVKEHYETLKRTVMVIVMEEDFPNTQNIKKYHTVWNFREKDYPDNVLSKKLEIHILELNKYKEMKEKTGEINAWLEFFINPYGKEVMDMARTYEELRAAVDQLIMLESDKEVSDMAFAEAMARLDEYYITKEATEAGHAEGLAKRNGRRTSKTD